MAGFFKEDSIEAQDHAEEWGEPDEPLTEGELSAMQISLALSDLAGLESDLTQLIDRVKYYGESVSREQLEKQLTQVREVVKILYRD